MSKNDGQKTSLTFWRQDQKSLAQGQAFEWKWGKIDIMNGETNIDVYYYPFCLDFCFVIVTKSPPGW